MMVTMAAGRSFRLASAAAEEENGRLGLLGRLQIALHSTVGAARGNGNAVEQMKEPANVLPPSNQRPDIFRAEGGGNRIEFFFLVLN